MQAIRAVLRAHGDVATWAQLTSRVPSHVVTHAVAVGRLTRILPRVYAEPDACHSPRIRAKSALLFAGTPSALSHTTALAQWPRLHLPAQHRIHVLTPRDRHRRSTAFVIVHRFGESTIPQQLVIERHGLATVVPARSLLDAWTVLPSQRRRAPIIDAVRLGLVQPDELEGTLNLKPKVAGRAELRRLIGLLRAGCQSELELLGFTRIFTDPRLPAACRQFTVLRASRRYVLDVAWPELLLAVELDGAAYHGSNDARERDVQRDSALARVGWLTIRITYERLLRDPAGIIQELLDIIAVRRRQLGRAA